MRTTKPLLTLAIIVASPFAAMADESWTDENTGIIYRSVNTPTSASRGDTVSEAEAGPYLPVVPTVADETHIATTAYVKGAYNDTIAAVNYLSESKQNFLGNDENGSGVNDVRGTTRFMDSLIYGEGVESTLPSEAAVVAGIKSQRVKIYTTWDDDRDSATTNVPLETVLPED